MPRYVFAVVWAVLGVAFLVLWSNWLLFAGCLLVAALRAINDRWGEDAG